LNTAPYATPDGIRAYLVSIEGLHRLREERRAASARFERLPPYCVQGRYVLTEDGRFGELTGVSAGAMKDLPDVLPLDEFDRRGRRVHGERWNLSYRTPASLAPPDRLCPECGNGWTYYGRSDVVEERERLTSLSDDGAAVETRLVVYRHARCHAAAMARDALWLAEDALERAGFPDAEPEPCPAAPRGFGAWHRVRTASGPFRFGPRGPGFGIDWIETGRDLIGTFCRIEGMTLFGPLWNEPPVDHGPFHVDPKDEAYLILYLRRLRLALTP